MNNIKLLPLALLFLSMWSGVNIEATDNSTKIKVSVDLEQKREKISPYIYGQFIEHLGRCIYGGIWAEMIQDRKFFDQPGTNESPWIATDVHMTTDLPFTGKWSPEFTLKPQSQTKSPALRARPLLVQKGFRLRSAIDYIGHLWVRNSYDVPMAIALVPIDSKTATPLIFEFKANTSADFVKYEFKLTGKIDPSSDYEFQILCKADAEGTVSIGTVSLMPSDNVSGMRADTLKLLAELNSPVYRWPGGNFVSGYNWKDGIGDRDRRPPRKNPAWKGIESNDFGINEFIQFCRHLDTDPYIAVNTGNGDLKSALEELEYANGAADTPMGKLRAAAGFEQPYHVRFWGIGNEMYGSWQIGFMKTEDYIKKHNEYVDAFRKQDKWVIAIGVGHVGPWDEAFIPGAFDHLDFLSEHIYQKEDKDILRHIHLLDQSIEHVAQSHEQYKKKFSSAYKGRRLQVVMDEWNYWYGPDIFGENGVRFFLKDTLGLACGLHAFYRHSNLYYMANLAQTVNVIGAIKTNQTSAVFEGIGHVLKMYRHEFGTIPVALTTEIPNGIDPKTFDFSAALADEGKVLTLGMVSASDQPKTIHLNLYSREQNIKVENKAKLFVVSDEHNDLLAHNEPGQPDRIRMTEQEIDIQDGAITLPPFCVAIARVKIIPPSEGKTTSP